MLLLEKMFQLIIDGSAYAYTFNAMYMVRVQFLITNKFYLVSFNVQKFIFNFKT